MKAFIGTTEGDLSIWHHTRLALSIAPTISRGAGGGGGGLAGSSLRERALGKTSQ